MRCRLLLRKSALRRAAKLNLPSESLCGRARLLPSLALTRQEPRPPGKRIFAARLTNVAHFRGAKGDTSVWHAQSEAWAWELWHLFLATHHALRKLRDVPHDERTCHTMVGILRINSQPRSEKRTFQHRSRSAGDFLTNQSFHLTNCCL